MGSTVPVNNSSALVVYNQNENAPNYSFSHYDDVMPQQPETINQIYLEEDYLDKKKRRRRRRRVRMAVGAASGVVVGGVILGPVGVVVGAVTGVVVTRVASKHGEKRKDARVAAAKAEADAVMGVDPSQELTVYRPAAAAWSPTEHVIV
jgi:hypothetical protein